MHDPVKCPCTACVQVRWYLDHVNAPDHPLCCVCPECALPREILRRSEQGTFVRDSSNNQWWAHSTGPGFVFNHKDALEAMRRYIENEPSRPRWPWLGQGTIEILERGGSVVPNPVDPQDAIDTFDLLHELGIPVRKDEP